MTPIEAMAKARHDRQCRDKRGRLKISWENNFPEYREHWIKEAAADLLALADCELPDEVVSSGWIDKEDVTPVEIFRAMLRSIANGGGQDVSASHEGILTPPKIMREDGNG